MSNKETMILPDFVEEPNIKNEGLEFEDMPDPFDPKNGEKVNKKEVKDADAEDAKNQEIGHKFLEYVGAGILR